MKIGFLTALRSDFDSPQESMVKRIMVNLAPMYLSAYLEKMGVEVEIQIKDYLDDLIPFAPDLLGITSVTENIEQAKELARRAKELWNPITILGGAHLTALPKSLPAEFDIGVIGEGEETFFELVKYFKRQATLDIELLKRISGLTFHTPAGVHQTAIRKGLDPLDEVPHPDRAKFIKETGLAYMMTSRGCPYTCSFCAIPQISEGYRKNSPAYVIEEIKQIKTNFPSIRHVRIFDDLYIVDRKRVIEIAERVEAEGLNQGLSFACWGRANLIDNKLMGAFKKMNMLYVAFGAESGSSRVMSKIKPGATVEQNQQAIDYLFDAGVKVSASFILGHPLENEGDLWATYEFIDRNQDKLLEIELNVAIPWPGTEFWHQAKARGLVHDKMDFNILKESAFFPAYRMGYGPYLNEQIPAERFEEIIDHFKGLFFKMHQKMMRQKALIRELKPPQRIASLQ